MAQTEKNTPRYMCLTGKTRHELAQSIDAAMQAAEHSDNTDNQQACYQICYEQLIYQLSEEFALDMPPAMTRDEVTDKKNLLAVMLKMTSWCARQWQLSVTQGATSAPMPEVFQMALKRVLECSLLDARDIMMAKGIWHFDIQGNLQQIKVRVFDDIDQFQSPAHR